MNSIPNDIDRLGVVFDDESLVADAGLLVAGTLMSRLGLERLLDETVRLGDRVGGVCPGRKVLSLVASMLVGGSHIDHADRLRAGSTDRVLPFRVMAPSTLGTFLRSFTWGHVRQMDKALGETLRRVWSVSGGPDRNPVTVDVDSTVCEVWGKTKHGAAYGYTGQLGYHPLVAVRSETAEIVHSRLRGADAFHRAHARTELAIRDIKNHAGLSHCPSGNFFANAAWLACATLSHNLYRWITHHIPEQKPGRLVNGNTVRTRLFRLPGRIVNHGRRLILRLPTRWPWANTYHTALAGIRNLPQLC